MSAVSVGPHPSPGATLTASPNPFSDACEIRQSGGAPDASPLAIYDARGRLVASVAALAPGRWSFRPAASWRDGLYFVRVAGTRRALVHLR